MESSPEETKNRVSLRFEANPTNDTVQDFTKLSGILVDTSLFQNPGNINYKLGANIKPGIHLYSLYTEQNGIKSNVDTVRLSYSEKSALNFSFGLLSYDILKGGEYDKRVNVNTLKFGLRGYITQRMSVDLDILFPNSGQNERVVGDSNEVLEFSIHSAALKLNYDLFPFNYREFISGESFAYLTVFGSFQQMIITGNEDTDRQLLGIGIKPRMQLFKQSKKIGALYLEGEVGFQFDLGRQLETEFYDSWFYGISLVYGFIKY